MIGWLLLRRRARQLLKALDRQGYPVSMNVRDAMERLRRAL